MDPLPPIPTPASQRWKEFRIQFLPLIVFGICIAGVILLWNHTIQPVGVVGEVELNTADVISLQDGHLVELTVERFSVVKAGQVLGYVTRRDDDVAAAEKAVVESELDVMRDRIMVTEDRRILNLQQLKTDLDKELTVLAESQPRLIRASNAFVRAEELINTDPKADYDLAKAEFEALKAAINMRTQTVASLRAFIDAAESRGGVGIENTIKAAKDARMVELEHSRRSPLRSPIDGIVNELFKSEGERLLQGEPVLRIAASGSQRIVAYIPQPLVRRPTVGDVVEIRTRSQPPTLAKSQIVSIGAQIEPIKRTLVPPDTIALVTGLPILVELPRELNVYPGELLNLSIDYSQN